MTESKRGRLDRLTKRGVDAARPQNARYIVWDGTLSGFGLRVEPTGRKTFVARYRAGGGRAGILRQETIGRYGALTVEEARASAKRILGKAAGGGDPLGERKAARQTGVKVSEVLDWYLREASEGHLLGRRGNPIKASTVAMDRSRIESHVRPLIGRKAVSSLSTADFEAMQGDIALGRTADQSKTKVERRPRGGRTTGGRGVAARTLGMVHAILEHARRAGMLSTNPARGARKMAGQRRQRRLDVGEIRALGAALQDRTENPVAVAAIRYALLSGFRRSEVLGIRKSDLQLTSGVNLADTKSGPQLRPVGRSAMAVLHELARLVNGEDGWLFRAERGSGHFIGLPKVLSRVCRRAKLDGVTLHTLRHSFASVAGEMGYSELVIAGLLGHRAGTATSGYVHLDKALVAAADQIASTIAVALDGKTAAEVVPLRLASAS